MTEEKIKELLLKDNEKFRKIYQEHQECEQTLSRLQAKSYLTEEDRVQEKLLKKKKLRLKDEMYRMILEFQRRTGHE
ncbi:MAG: DUF465 domain-containing protein [Candidatus Saccharicenans sp.]|uniref:DUF465 domain-containing protein n=1 Tax=Candidatus Saccharicenans sp. TaxID=2819258 RepID=UPI00404A298E